MKWSPVQRIPVECVCVCVCVCVCARARINVCDMETSKLRRPMRNWICWVTEKSNTITKKHSSFQNRIIDQRSQPFVIFISVVNSGDGRTNRRTHLVNKIPEKKVMSWNLKNSVMCIKYCGSSTKLFAVLTFRHWSALCVAIRWFSHSLPSIADDFITRPSTHCRYAIEASGSFDPQLGASFKITANCK
jgi:hypothetical protein